MTEIEIATGTAIAAQGAAECARKRNQLEQELGVVGSRSHTCHNANGFLLNQAYEALELAVRLLFQAKDREARMMEQ
jgi:hypothetical protein